MSDQQLNLFVETPASPVRKPEIEVIRSSRRKKTVEASQRNGVLRIIVPAHISQREEQHWIDEMLRISKKRSVADEVELKQRAAELAERYRLPQANNIKWIKDQKSRWAYCDLAAREVSICEQVQHFPQWVVDYVIVHELAHFCEAKHNKHFWDLVKRYPRTERARGYLIAKSEGTRDL